MNNIKRHITLHTRLRTIAGIALENTEKGNDPGRERTIKQLRQEYNRHSKMIRVYENRLAEKTIL